MAFGPHRANLIQVGLESSLSATATPIPATTKWRGEAIDIEDARKLVRVPENIGLAGNTDRLYVASLMGKLAFPSTPFTFEQGPIIFQCGLKNATPGAATAYLRTFALPVANVPNAIQTASLEAGNAVIGGDAHVLTGSFVSDFSLDGKAGQDGGAWMIAANWEGQQKAIQAFTAALSAPTVEEALFNYTKLYIDDVGGTIGTTLKSSVLVAASIKVKTGWMIVPTADGHLYFIAIKYVIPDDQVRFDLTFELEDTTGVVIAERAKYVSRAIRLIRLDCQGSSADKNLQINLAGRYDKFSTYANTNGNVTVQASGYAVISGSDYFSIAVKNGLATLA